MYSNRPCADTHHQTYPTTWDNSYHPIKIQAEEDFIVAQIDKEVYARRYAKDFRPELLPRMYCSPIHKVPKSGTDTFGLINDQSAGELAPNLMVNYKDITKTYMDRIKSLDTSLQAF
jgi:hypothetical protein